MERRLVLSRCCFCGRAFSPNATVGGFPVERRIAFDPARGRLWTVCRLCKQWTLAPIDARWEAIEELARITADRARLLVEGAGISLLHAGDFEIVRIGSASFETQAWWRYGRVLTQGRSVYRWVRSVNNLAFGAVVAAVAVTGNAALVPSLGAWLAPGFFNGILRERRFGTTAWKGQAPCVTCGRTLPNLNYTERAQLLIRSSLTEPLSVRLRCERCGTADPEAGYRIPEAEGTRLLRQVLAYESFGGASDRSVRKAIRVIDAAGSPEQLIAACARKGIRIGALGRPQRLGLAVAINEEVERALLATEIEGLESQWQAAEEVASIADGELTHVPALDRLKVQLGRASSSSSRTSHAQPRKRVGQD